MKIKIVCRDCGSEKVMRDAWAEWDVVSQQWRLKSVFDQAYCDDCDAETKLVELELAEPD